MYAILRTQARQIIPGAVTHRIEAPIAVIPVELTHHHTAYITVIIRQLKTNQLAMGGLINKPYIGIGYIAKMISIRTRFINGYDKSNSGYAGV